jgi:hypothetical protein
MFLVRHPSDGPFYDAIKAFNAEHGIHALPFPPPRGSEGGGVPVLTLQDVLGGSASPTTSKAIDWITNNKQIVFHSLGDCGSTRGPATQNLVVDKMLADFNEASDIEVPQFHMLLGDIVYSFGEVKYYYDQFYDPYRDYPAPILAAAGNTTEWWRPKRARNRSMASCETSAPRISSSCPKPAASPARLRSSPGSFSPSKRLSLRSSACTATRSRIPA